MYTEIGICSEPAIIGVKDLYQVEFSEKKSFVSDDEKKYYKEYFDDEVESFLTTNFKNFKKSKLTKLTYFPFKKAKETDFIRFTPFELGLDFIVSQKVMDIFEQFTLPDYIKIPAKIEGFKNDYYTIGFPMIPGDKIDYSNSKFINDLSREIVVVNTREEYLEKIVELSGRKIKMIDKLPFDVISTQGQGIFFSDKLIETLEEEDITGLRTYNTVLE